MYQRLFAIVVLLTANGLLAQEPGAQSRKSLPLTAEKNASPPSSRGPLPLTAPSTAPSQPLMQPQAYSSAYAFGYFGGHAQGNGYAYGMAQASVSINGVPQKTENNYPAWSDRDPTTPARSQASAQAQTVTQQGALQTTNFAFDDGDQVVRIYQTPRSIRVRVKPKSKGSKELVYAAKNLAELEKQEPEGFRLYNKFIHNQAKVGAVPLSGDVHNDASDLMKNSLRDMQQNFPGLPMDSLLQKMREQLDAAHQ